MFRGGKHQAAVHAAAYNEEIFMARDRKVTDARQVHVSPTKPRWTVRSWAWAPAPSHMNTNQGIYTPESGERGRKVQRAGAIEGVSCTRHP